MLIAPQSQPDLGSDICESFWVVSEVCIIMNLTLLWWCRRFDRRLRSSLPGLYRAERCEKPHRETTIQGETLSKQHVFFLYHEIDLYSVCRILSFPFSWTSVSRRTQRSTSPSVPKAASDQWGCSWWRRVRSRNFASTWWPSRIPHPTPSKCNECCAGKSLLTSSWEKPSPETSCCCGEQDKACGLWLWWALTEWNVFLIMNEVINCAFGNF